MLVVKEFKIDKEADNFLKIVGRQSGVISWLLSIVGISPITELQCNRREVIFRAASLRKGNVTVGIPNTAVTTVAAGYIKPFKALVVAICGFFFALFMLSKGTIDRNDDVYSIAFTGLIVGIVSIISYLIGKKTIFAIYAGGDKPVASLEIKNSVTEGIQITEGDIDAAAVLLRNTVICARERHDSAETSSGHTTNNNVRTATKTPVAVRSSDGDDPALASLISNLENSV